LPSWTPELNRRPGMFTRSSGPGRRRHTARGSRAARGAGRGRQPQSSASYGASTLAVTASPSSTVVAVTVADPAGTADARAANDWYALLPGVTSANAF